MNDSTRQYTQYVLRRLEEPLRLFGMEVPPAAWLVLLIAIVQVGFIYIGVMYGRESKGGRWLWAGLMAILHAVVFGVFALAFNHNQPDGAEWKYCAALAVAFSSIWGLAALVMLVVSREGFGERAGWAAMLGLLRASVYVFIAIIFLLPARQDWEESKRESKVVLVMDVSGSISATVDDLPDENTPIEKLLTRQDKVLTFLNNPKVNFIPRLEEKNPVTAYRFGRQADLDYRLHSGGRFYNREQWEKRAEVQARGDAPHPGYALQSEHLDVWMKPERPKLPLSWVRPELRGTVRERIKLDDTLVLRDEVIRAGEFLEAREVLPEHQEDYKEWLRQLTENRKQSQNGMYNGTAVGESLSALMRREMNNMVQGVVVFTDGRSTEGAAQAYRDLAEMARRSKIPMFVVGVGSERQMVNIDIADLRVPPQIRPEDKFRTVVALTGAGLDNEPAPRFDGVPDEKKGIKGPSGYQVALDISRVSRDKDGKEKNEDILIVTLDKDGEPTKDPPINLGQEIILTQDWAKTSEFVKVIKDIDENRKEKDVRFKPSSTGAPASAQVEFEIEAEVLMRAANKELAENTRYGFFPDPNSELRFRVRVPKDKREIMVAREHVSDPADVRVLKRPLRVLLFTSSATREYQFLQTLFVREMDKNRAEVCIHFQPLPDAQTRTGRVQSVPPERMLPEFPTRMDADKEAKPEERFQALSSYDVIIAFDVDFTRLSREQVGNLQRWVDQKGGGLIVIGGSINTVQMTRPVSREAMEPILTLLPVVLDDERIHIAERRTDRPFRLTFPGATPDMEFLKLFEVDDRDDKVTDPEKQGDVVASWNRFFNTYETESGKVDVRDNPESVPYRGFYSVYPSKRVKDNAIMVASFADATLRMPNGKEQPYLAMNSYGKGKVVWLGSGELWRLRSYRENWHDRFWIKLARAVGGGSLNTASRRIVPVMSRYGVTNKAQMFEAKFENRDGQPLARDVKDPPMLTVTLPPGVLVQRGDRVKITKGGEYAGKEGRVLGVASREGKLQVTVEVTSGETRKEVVVQDNEVEIVIPPLALRPKLGTDNDGWFDVEFQPKASGEYKLTLSNPDTGDTYLHKFIVKESNPELDNVKPDFELMYSLASDADPVLARITDENRKKELRDRLAKPKLSGKDSAKKDIEKEKDEALKLYFDLNNADLIPQCMAKDTQILRNRGPVKDLWDDGPVLWDFGTTDKPPIKLPILLCVIVGLLSIEWLTRKLLRMA